MAKKQFKAESKRLLELMINSIYTNREIFLRELISNASDALDKRYYEGLTDPAKNAAKKDLWIKIYAYPDERKLVIEDTGIGMSEEELEKNLGTIAKSGSAEFREALEKDESKVDLIGQFGVGFYSAFMVAKNVIVETKPAGSDKAYRWESSGEDGYTITEIEREQPGTRITLELKEDTEDEKFSEFLEEYTIRNLVRKYSDYVRYPIKMDVKKSIPDPTDENKTIDTFEEETLNSMIPLWKKNRNDISKEDYDEFYKGNFSDWENPQKVIHYNVEGNISYTALLYLPGKTPFNFYNTDYESGLKLYSKGVFILDNAKDLLPECYRFVKGLVDSDDLNLNISREILQQDRQVKALAKSIDKKITKALEDMLETEREEYEKFFENFGLNLKYSIYKSYGMEKDKLQDLLLFRSSSEGKYTTLKEYVERMKEDQKEIYYVSGSSIEEIEKLPVLAKVKNKGYEILYFTDSIDEFVIRMMMNYSEKNFRSITEAGLDLDSEEEKKVKEEKAEANKDLLAAMKESLGDRVSEVRISSRLTDDPVCIVADQGMSIEMEKVLSQDPMNRGMKATKILEINPNHPIFEKLRSVFASNPAVISDYADILYEQARLIEGLPIEDPAEYARRIVSMMVQASVPARTENSEGPVEAEIVD
ncbi:MAG: molecular chaperone HtpG [Solobacterium sp.]|nr:molecular chaperone HtpG [Solobacterium sp.]